MTTDIPHKVRVAIRARSEAVCERCRRRTAQDPAHRMPRAAGGHASVNIAHLCRVCHDWCHANPRKARLEGWIIAAHRKIRPSDVAAIPMRRLSGEYIVFSEHTDARGRLIGTATTIPAALAMELLDAYGISEAVTA